MWIFAIKITKQCGNINSPAKLCTLLPRKEEKKKKRLCDLRKYFNVFVEVPMA